MFGIARKAVAVTVSLVLLVSSAREGFGQEAEDAAVRERVDYRLQEALTVLVEACNDDVLEGQCDIVRGAGFLDPSDEDWSSTLKTVGDSLSPVPRERTFQLQFVRYLSDLDDWPEKLNAEQSVVKEECSGLGLDMQGVRVILDGEIDLDDASAEFLDCVEAIVEAEKARAKAEKEAITALELIREELEECGNCPEAPDLKGKESEIEIERERLRGSEGSFNPLLALLSWSFFLQALVAAPFTGGESMEDWAAVFYGATDPDILREVSYESLPRSAGEDLDTGQEAELEGDEIPFLGVDEGLPVRFRLVGAGADVELRMYVGSYPIPWNFRDCAEGEADEEGCVVNRLTRHSPGALLREPGLRFFHPIATGVERMPDGRVRWEKVTLRGEAGGVCFTILEDSTGSKTYQLVVEEGQSCVVEGQ